MKIYGSIKTFIEEVLSEKYILDKAKNVNYNRNIDEKGRDGLWDFSINIVEEIKPKLMFETNQEDFYNALWEFVEEKRSINLFEKVKKWAKERNLENADPFRQFVKLNEELGELANGMLKDKEVQIKDSLGDIQVVLIILAMQLGYDLESCLEYAYNEIKDRTGVLKNGTFVKSEDL